MYVGIHTDIHTYIHSIDDRDDKILLNAAEIRDKKRSQITS